MNVSFLPKISLETDKRDESGALMLETSIVIMLLFSFVFALIEGGTYYTRYSILDFATTRVLRRLSVNVENARTPEALQTEANRMARELIAGLLGSNPEDLSFEAVVFPLDDGGFVLELTGRWSSPSLSGNSLLGDITFSSTKSSRIGDECFSLG